MFLVLLCCPSLLAFQQERSFERRASNTHALFTAVHACLASFRPWLHLDRNSNIFTSIIPPLHRLFHSQSRPPPRLTFITRRDSSTHRPGNDSRSLPRVFTFRQYKRLTGGRRAQDAGVVNVHVEHRASSTLPSLKTSKTLYSNAARRALVGLFGEGRCSQESVQLPQKIREAVLKGVSKRTTAQNTSPPAFCGRTYALEDGRCC